MAANRKISQDVLALVSEIGLETLGPKLDALGVRGVADLELVDDSDLVRWGLSTIERRRFFSTVRSRTQDKGELSGGSALDGLDLVPPSSLTSAPSGLRKTAGQRKTRREGAAAFGPARLDELLGRGSAEQQLPKLAERVLASTGPLEVPELACRLARTAPALAQGYDDKEWPQFVEAAMRGCPRLNVEQGVLADDKPIVAIRNTVLYSVSEEVVSDLACWLRVALYLTTPSQVSILATLCRSSREVADGPAVWGKLLNRWYPRATLMNPDYLAQAELEKRLEAALDNDYTLAALCRGLENDTPLDIGDLLAKLPQQSTPKALVKFMSSHSDNFKQSPDGKKFAVCLKPQEGGWRQCNDWRAVNPFQAPPAPQMPVQSSGSSRPETGGKAPVAAPMGRPTELRENERQVAASSSSSAPAVPTPAICQQLDPKQAFRLYHTGLLSQRSDHSKRGKLEAWEYYTESNAKCLMAPSDLLNLAENRVNSIRMNDPAVVHELVAQTLEGLVYKVGFGYWNRRVRIMTNALNSSQFRVGREQRKKYERKLLEFMKWVEKERGFGYYQCEACGCRWKSGFSYEEIMQQCLQCGAFNRPYRIQDLETVAERLAREKGEPLPAGAENRESTRAGACVKGNKGKGKGKEKCGKGKDLWRDARLPWAGSANGPWVNFEAPTLEHGDGRGFRRPRPGEGEAWERNQRPRVGTQLDAPRIVDPPPRASQPNPTSASQEQASLDNPAAGTGTSTTTPAEPVRYSPGGGGFFARRRSQAESGPQVEQQTVEDAIMSEPLASNSEADTPQRRYVPGRGGFFSRRREAGPAAEPVSTITERQSETDASSASAAPVQNSTIAGSASSAAENQTAVPVATYKPGGGGYFARLRAQASDATPPNPAPLRQESGTDSANNTGASSDSLPQQEVDQTGATSSVRPLPSANGSQNEASVTPLRGSDGQQQQQQSLQVGRYKPGGGGFFARRQAAAVDSNQPAPAPSVDEVHQPEEATTQVASVDEVHQPEGATSQVGDVAVSSATGKAHGASVETEGVIAVQARPANGSTDVRADDDELLSTLPKEKLLAIQTLGLSVAEALAMGIITPAANPATAASSGDKRSLPEKPNFEMQAEERRLAAATRFRETSKNFDPSHTGCTGAETNETAVASDESLTDALAAVCKFTDPTSGKERGLAATPADVAFVISDSIFWPLVRRIAVEIESLEANSTDLTSFWPTAPHGSESVVKFADFRGYVLPAGMVAPATSSFWRRAFLADAASDLLAVRVIAGRGFDLGATAGPCQHGTSAISADTGANNLEGVASAVDSSASLPLAANLLTDIAQALEIDDDPSAAHAERIRQISAATLRRDPVDAGWSTDAADAPALVTGDGWTLLQEMGVREAAHQLREEYTVRRQILLHRLDCTVQCMSTSERAMKPTGRRKVADILSRMWAGWRLHEGAGKAPPLSEWSALAVTRGVLSRAVCSRVASSHARPRNNESVRNVLIGEVPNRGGLPDGYRGGAMSSGGNAVSSESTVNSSKKPKSRSSITTLSEGTKQEIDEAKSSSVASVGDGAPTNHAYATTKDKGTGENANEKINEKRPVKGGTLSGARSVNKELMEQAKQEKKKEQEEDRPKTYWQDLSAARC